MSQSTINDVAIAAEVSTATVSRYLSGQQVRNGDRIQRAIEALSFRPSPAARSLKSGVTRSIGVVVPDVTNPYFAAVVKGIESVSSVGDYSIFLCNSDEQVEREQKLLAQLQGRVDGIILAPATEGGETLGGLQRLGVPIVFLDRELTEEDGFDTVLVDNYEGGRQAAEYLLELGHQDIGLISGPLNTTPGRGRHEGFLGALEAGGVDLDEDYLHVGDFRSGSGYQATLRLLALPRPPTAIFAANNMMSIGALRALHDMGVRLPADVSFIGFDDLELGELLTPPLTAIDRPMTEQGVLAMRLLLNRLDGLAEPSPRRIVLETRLIVRGSCVAVNTNAALAPGDSYGTEEET